MSTVEIERQFLVADCPPLGDLMATAIRQGYITDGAEGVEVRVRQKGDAYFLTVKCGGDIRRSEFEVAITADQFHALWPATTGRRLGKTRYTGRLDDGRLFELDRYGDPLAPLVVVEVEFATLDDAAAFTPPPWFGPEVSGDRRYKNKALAVAAGPPAA